MPHFSKRIPIVLVVLSLLIASPALSQSSLNQILQPPTSGKPAPQADPFGRNTPSGTTIGFLQAAQAGNYSIAAQYLQMSPARRQSEGEQTAMKLKTVMDRAFAGSLKNVSTQPEGNLQEGVSPDHQKLGPLSSGDVEGELELVRVNDAVNGKIWLIGSETLSKLPELYDQVEARQVENKLPNVLVKHQFLGMPLWQWIALLLAIPVAAAIAWIVLAVLQVPLRWWARRRGQHDIADWRSVPAPVWLLVATFVHRILVRYLGMPLLQRHYYVQFASVAFVIGVNWILWRLIQWALRRVRNRALARGHAGTGSLMLLGERILKAIVFVMAVLLVFNSLGFNMSTALAGLGIGGLAIGFGAQKTIENLFGGVSVLGDEVMRVGDVCRFGDRTGTVEDIGLRSTRVRTEERTLLAIPNGTIATINIENLSRRDKIIFKMNLGLSSETKADHLRYVVTELRRLLYSHARIETTSVRVRLVDISSGSHMIEIRSYVLTQDFDEFMAVREDLLFRMIDIIEDSGASLSQPSQTLFLRRDAGGPQEKVESAVKKIEELREGKQLPFPDLSRDDISSLKGSIDYPPADSATRNSAKDSRR